jgi:hypothetical protein
MSALVNSLAVAGKDEGIADGEAMWRGCKIGWTSTCRALGGPTSEAGNGFTCVHFQRSATFCISGPCRDERPEWRKGAEHWKHLRTTNQIESVFATVRLRHRRTKGNGSHARCLATVHQLMLSAAKQWWLLNGYDLLPDVVAAIQFIDGVKSQHHAA